MFHASFLTRSRYIPVVGRAFLVEMLYGSKYSPHIGTYHMPYLYVKTLLLCATGKGLSEAESRHVHGLVEALLPSNMSEDNLTKLELMQFVDSVPLGPTEEGATPTSALSATDTDVEGGIDLSESASPPYNEDVGDDGSGRHASREEAHHAYWLGAAAGGPGGAELSAAASFISATAFPSTIARMLVYDAVSACLADGVYSAQERERVALVAAQIGLSSAVREEVEKLATQERVIAARKRKLLNLPPSSSSATAPRGASSFTDTHAAKGGAALSPPHAQRPGFFANRTVDERVPDRPSSKSAALRTRSQAYRAEDDTGATFVGGRAGDSRSGFDHSISHADGFAGEGNVDLGGGGGAAARDEAADAREYAGGGYHAIGEENEMYTRRPRQQAAGPSPSSDSSVRKDALFARQQTPVAESVEMERVRKAKELLRALRAEKIRTRGVSNPSA